MPFELRFILKYLFPSSRNISTFLFSVLSISVISLVVCLVLLFLSFNEGIKQKWIDSLTTINAPIQIYPKEQYYNSYYYNIDTISNASGYKAKTLGEKLASAVADPFDPYSDQQPLVRWAKTLSPEGTPRDLVKELSSILSKERVFSKEYLNAAAIMKLRTGSRFRSQLLTQASYISSFSTLQTPSSPILPPRFEDIQTLFTQLQMDERAPLERLLLSLNDPLFSLDSSSIFLYAHDLESFYADFDQSKGVYILSPSGKGIAISTLSPETPIYLPPSLKGNFISFVDEQALLVRIAWNLGGGSFEMCHSPEELVLISASAKTCFDSHPEVEPLWCFFTKEDNSWHLPTIEGREAIVLPKKFYRYNGHIGDSASLVFSSEGALSSGDRSYETVVVGFYDPGILSGGLQAIYGSKEFLQQAHSLTSSLPLDRSLLNGFFLSTDLRNVQSITLSLRTAIADAGLSEFFEVTPYYEYEFAQELLGQFRSEELLFTLISFVILAVASTNIFALLLLLVQQKRKEIAILRSLGASKKSIASIFGATGLIISLVSIVIGTALALYVLDHLSSIVSYISSLQGHSLFPSTIYGDSLPNKLSTSAVVFVAIAAPIIAIFASSLPAYNASRVEPTPILKGE